MRAAAARRSDTDHGKQTHGAVRVDVAAFDGVALPALREAMSMGGVLVVDELGRMELALSGRLIDWWRSVRRR